MDEQQAIARLKQGDINGLEFLVQQYQVQAVHTAYLIIGDRSQAEDVTQAAFLKVARKIAQFDARYPFRPWFLRIVVNDAIKAAKRQQKNISLDEPADEAVSNWLLDKAPRPEELAETGDLRQEVWNALRQLSPEQRTVILQRHFLEMSEAEMAEKLQKPASTIKWWLHTARERLRQLLKPYQVSGEMYED
jgi:RNA polymerase sigma-70 factor, ECF subfamily